MGAQVAAICCIVPIHCVTARMALAWVASEDGGVSLWVGGETPSKRQAGMRHKDDSFASSSHSEMEHDGSTEATEPERQGIVAGLQSHALGLFQAAAYDVRPHRVQE